jgi:uncharacterized protein (DUF2235 family)
MALYAIDGTWNKDDDKDLTDTNVVKFCQAHQDNKGEYYTSGVGTRLGAFGRLFGGLIGVGGRDRVRDSYKEVCKNFLDGDQNIDIAGFSRGAALALHLANVIARKGIRDPKSNREVEKDPEIRFVALWDVVGSFGIPIDIGGLPFQKTNLGIHLNLPKNVQHCYHAMALDERRQSFQVTRVQGAYEVWFRGVHSDIGGGNTNVGLNNIALRWMLRKAAAAGVPVDRAKAEGLKVDPDAELREPKDLVQNMLRKTQPGDRFHYSVTARPGGRCNNPPEGCLRENEDAELRLA